MTRRVGHPNYTQSSWTVGWRATVWRIELHVLIGSGCRVPGVPGTVQSARFGSRFKARRLRRRRRAGPGTRNRWNRTVQPRTAPLEPGTRHQEPRMAVVRNVAGNQGGTRRRRSKASARRRSTSHRNCPSRDRPWLDHSWRSVGITGTVPYLFIALRQPPPIRRPDRTRRSGRERSHRRSGSRSGGAPSCRPACRHEESRWMATRVDIR
jgi:hypothetical protein